MGKSGTAAAFCLLLLLVTLFSRNRKKGYLLNSCLQEKPLLVVKYPPPQIEANRRCTARSGMSQQAVAVLILWGDVVINYMMGLTNSKI